MDMDAVRKKRQEEIEAKKKRLEELKKAKEAAASAPKATDAAPKPAFTLPTPTSPLPSTSRPQTIIPEERDPTQESKAEQDTNDLVSSLLSTASSSTRGGGGGKSTSGDFDVQYNRAEKIKSFSLAKLSTNIMPVERVTYDKDCQTEEDDQTFLRDNEAEEDSKRFYDNQAENMMTPGRKSQNRSSTGTNNTSSSDNNTNTAGDNAISSSSSQQTPHFSSRKISEEEKQQILIDDKFLQFFEHASLHVERALEFNTTFDVLRDYTADTSKQTSGEKAITHTQTYYDCEYLRQRPIMDLKSSVLRPELFLAAYGSKPSLLSSSSATANKLGNNSSTNGSSEDDAPGMVCIWARDMHSRPEIKLIASSPVLTAEFHHSEPQLVFGGCYNGQILLWDMSKSRSLPVQRSSWIAGKGHKHPVYAMALTMSHELVTISIDGMLCLWDVARLTEPISTSMLEIPVPKALSLSHNAEASQMQGSTSSLFSPPPADFRVNQPPLNVSCMAYAQSDNNASHIIVGSGAGELFKTQLPYKFTEPANLKLDAHFGLITAVHTHPMTNSTKYKHLLLTSSLDWTVKLWSAHHLQQPLYEFFSPSCDYVCDVQWSPTHPAVFFTVSSTGQVALWNLSKSLTEPVDILLVTKETHDDEANNNSNNNGANSASTSSKSNNNSSNNRASAVVTSTAALLMLPSALNKALFSCDGQFVLVGDSTGVLHRLKVHPQHVSISASDESRLNMVLLTANNLLTVAQSPAGKHSKQGSILQGQKDAGIRGASLLEDFEEDAPDNDD